MSVSRSLKLLCGGHGNRPSDWFSQKSCAAQYGKLLENVETPKRKKRTEKDTALTSVETPSESILRKLTQERMAELNNLIQAEQKDYTKTKDEILAIQSNAVDETKFREMWVQIDMEKKQREKEQQQHAQWLKEREERKIELERAWRPNPHVYHQQNSPNQSPSKAPGQLNIKVKPEDMEVDESTVRQGTSPLLTSLLKSPSPAPNPGGSILHNPTGTSRVIAPTITNLLTGATTSTNIQTSFATQHNIQTVYNQPITSTPPPPYEQSVSNVIQTPSQAAPTLSMLLENKKKENSIQKIPPLVRMEPLSMRQQETNIFSPTKTELFPVTSTEPIESVGSPIKDEDQQLMEVFKGLIPDNIDELADILTDNNAIMLNSELLEEESLVESLMAEENIDESVTDQADPEEFNAAVEGFLKSSQAQQQQPLIINDLLHTQQNQNFRNDAETAETTKFNTAIKDVSIHYYF